MEKKGRPPLLERKNPVGRSGLSLDRWETWLVIAIVLIKAVIGLLLPIIL